jgi:hypothetical protein
MMDIIKLVDDMSHEMYLRLKYAAEVGKWPDGGLVDKAQREHALQLSMAYQARHLNSDEMLTIGADGELVTKTKRQLKEEFADNHSDNHSDNNKSDSEQSPNSIARFTNL